MSKRLIFFLSTLLAMAALVVLAFPVLAQDGDSENAEAEARNKQTVYELYEETNAGNVEFLRGVLADDFISYGGAGFEDLVGPDAFIGLYYGFMEAFPDLQFEVTHVIADGDLVAVRGIQTATHTGNFLGMVPATNKEVAWTGTAIFRFNEDGQIIERWQDLDQLGLFMQLEVIPPFTQPGG